MMRRRTVVDVCQSAWAGRRGPEGFFVFVFVSVLLQDNNNKKKFNTWEREVSANSQIAVKSVTHGRIQQHQQLSWAHSFLFMIRGASITLTVRS
jgi:hypothetical protein